MPHSEIVPLQVTQVEAESLIPAFEIPLQDRKLIEMWLHGKSANSQNLYRRYVTQFLSFIRLPLANITPADLQAFAVEISQAGRTESSQKTILCAIKSLLTFGCRIGVLPVNVGAALKLPKVRNTLVDRILSEADVIKMTALETDPRNRMILRLAYACGLRVSEIGELTWNNFKERGEGEGQVTVFGKGGKTRTIRIPHAVWKELMEFRGKKKTRAEPTAPVFRSRKKGEALTRKSINDIIKNAALRAGLSDDVSPHWLRHCHASHALDRGAPIHLVQQTLGHASVATTSGYLHARPSDSSSRYLPL